MLYPRHQSGKTAEQRACHYLQQQGLRLVTQNFRCKPGEIDLIMQDNTHCIFIEVRNRKNQQFGGAAASITHSKQQKLIRAAHYFLQTQPSYAAMPCRFDVITIDGSSTTGELCWIRDAFLS